MQVLIHAPGGTAQALAMLRSRCNDRIRVKVQQVCDKLIRVMGPYPKSVEGRRGKVVEIPGNDDVSSGTDRGGQDVTIILVRKNDRWNQGLEILNETILNTLIHESSRALKAFPGQVGSVSQQCLDPFLVHFVRPSCAE